MTTETVRTVRDSLVPIVLTVVALLLFGALLAVLLTRFGVFDGTTAFLAASPGALSQMSALGQGLGADATLVATVHTVRVVTGAGVADRGETRRRVARRCRLRLHNACRS